MVKESTVNTVEDNPQETTYSTRHGGMTAPRAADFLLERSCWKAGFLATAFDRMGEHGNDLTLPGNHVMGLAAILEDITYDLETLLAYHRGENDSPGA